MGADLVTRGEDSVTELAVRYYCSCFYGEEEEEGDWSTQRRLKFSAISSKTYTSLKWTILK